MTSITIVVLLSIALLALTAWALGRTARALGSVNGRFGKGMIAAVTISLVAIVINLFGLLLAPYSSQLILSVVDLLLFLFSIFFLLEYMFRLSAARTFAMLGAYWAISLLELGLVLLIVRPLVIEAFLIHTASMSPTLNPGERFMVNKVLHPRRWDLVAYWSHSDPQPERWCKRIVALPGERLRFEGGAVYINDQLMPAPPVVNGRYHATLPVHASQPYHDGQTIVLGRDEFFVVGDNMDLSDDSRMLGPTPRSDMVGVVDVIYWPLNRAKVLR